MMFRVKAFAIHLAISILIAVISLYLVFVVWHSAPLAKAVGVTHVFLMMLAIDAVLGPILTFIVAKPNKKSLKFDLAVIIILQLCAYTYGMYNISINRPVYIAFDTKRFELVQAGDVPKSSLEIANAEYNRLGYSKPKWVAVIPPKDAAEQSKRIFDEMGDGVAPSMQPHLYEPIDNQWQQINNEARSLAELDEFNSPSQVKSILSKRKSANGWLPLKAFNQSMVVLLNEENNEVIDIVDLRPW